MTETSRPEARQTMTDITISGICSALSQPPKNALIIGHNNPDGDCVGSACALREIIRAMGGGANVTFSGDFPDRLRFMCSDDLAPEECVVTPFDLIIAVDVASPGQTGKNKGLIDRIDIMIDHHRAGEAFAPAFIDPEASAAGEIVSRIYKELVACGKLSEDPRIARFLYAAISSDTGSFMFSNTTRDTLLTVADLSESINTADDGGLDTSDIARLLFSSFTEKEMRAKLMSMKNTALYEDGLIGVVTFTMDDLDDYGLSSNDTGNSVDIPRSIAGVLIALSIRQLDDCQYKFRLSSRTCVDIDCAAVCQKYGGGGHSRAAGCTIEADDIDEATQIAVEEFSVALHEYLKNNPITEPRI